MISTIDFNALSVQGKCRADEGNRDEETVFVEDAIHGLSLVAPSTLMISAGGRVTQKSRFSVLAPEACFGLSDVQLELSETVAGNKVYVSASEGVLIASKDGDVFVTWGSRDTWFSLLTKESFRTYTTDFAKYKMHYKLRIW